MIHFFDPSATEFWSFRETVRKKVKGVYYCCITATQVYHYFLGKVNFIMKNKCFHYFLGFLVWCKTVVLLSTGIFGLQVTNKISVITRC